MTNKSEEIVRRNAVFFIKGTIEDIVKADLPQHLMGKQLMCAIIEVKK